MRNLKRFLAVLVVVAVMATSMIPAFAADAELSPIEVVTGLGIVEGAGNGVDEEYLAADTTKIQAAVILLKALGLYEEAIDFDGEENFADADEVTWAAGRRILAYLKANPELGWVGNPDGTFDAYAVIEPAQLYKVMLELLGYEQNVDFKWSEVLEKAVEFGMAGEYVDGEGVTNEDMIGIIYEALYTPVKGGTEEDVLLVYLAEINEAIKEKAIELGLIVVEEEPGEITMTASAIAADTIKVSFNQPVDDTKAVFTVKKGSVTVNVSKIEFAEDKASATLTLANKMTKGEYTVTVSGLTEEALVAKITVEDQKVTKIELTSDKLVIGSKVENGLLVEDREHASVGYKLFDQYGTDVTKAKDGEVEWTVTSAKVISFNDGVLEVEYSGTGGFVLDMPVVVTGINKVTAASVTATLKVAPMAYVSEITLGEVTVNPGKDDKVINTENIGNFHIPMTVADQYGNPMKEENIVAADLLVMPVNVKATVDTDEDGNLILALSKADNQYEGYAAVNVVAKHSAAKAKVEFTVDKVQTINDFSMDLPDLLVAGDKDIKVPFTALDQYGNEVNDVDKLNDMISKATVAGIESVVAGTNGVDFKFKKNYKTDKAELFMDLSNAKEGTGYFTVITPGLKHYQTNFTVQKKAEPVLVSGTKDLILNMVKGTAKAEIAGKNIVLKDQYGRDFDWDKLTADYRVVLETSDEAKVDFNKDAAVAKTVYFANKDDKTSLGANDVGSAKITATLQKEVEKDGKKVFENISDSAYSFTLKVVKATDVKTYEVADLGTIYGGINDPTNENYEKKIDIVGKLADGSKVVLNDEVIAGIRSTNAEALDVKENEKVIRAVYGSGDDVKAGVIITIETANGAENIFKEVIVSYKAPEAAKIEATDSVTDGVYELKLDKLVLGKIDLDTLELFNVTDQYGVKINGTAPADLSYLATNKVYVADNGVTANISIDKTDNKTLIVSNAKAGSNFILTAVTPNGKYESIKVILVD